jgi:hypothetical protein
LQVGLEDPGTTGPDGPAFHQRGGANPETPQKPSGLFFSKRRFSFPKDAFLFRKTLFFSERRLSLPEERLYFPD